MLLSTIFFQDEVFANSRKLPLNNVTVGVKDHYGNSIFMYNNVVVSCAKSNDMEYTGSSYSGEYKNGR